MSEIVIGPSFQGAYPERSIPRYGKLDRAAQRIASPFQHARRVFGARSRGFVAQTALLGPWAALLNKRQMLEEAAALGEQLRLRGFEDSLVAKSFALTREAATRTLGQRHHDVQLIGGRVLLHGLIAEMETGEGKTLTATLAASAAALSGIPVHVITVNDYLAGRDAEWMKPVYQMLGLRVGTIVHGLDPDERREAYSADITYCTNKEVAFDYLKDRIVLGRDAGRIQLQAERLYDRRPRLNQLLLRGLFFGIVDEADSVLVDEARTPLIISGPNGNASAETEICKTALSIADELADGRDFVLEQRTRAVRLLPEGLDRLSNLTKDLGGVWIRRNWREELVRQAISAKYLFLLDKQYLVKDGKVQIIDEYTGRIMPDRSWQHGLHQMIEAKEGCEMSERIDHLAKISYQRFFRRYLRLAGMTGTAREVTGELWSVYRLATVRIPTNKPLRRQRLKNQIHATQEEKWRSVVRRIEEVHASGRPVLIGTRSVAASEHLSKLLTMSRLPHQLLNARQDADEAMIVGEGGGRGRITVATNMAGRGTDIKLEAGVRELGGLYVIATELHEASRIDRQLFGRCGRQGDPGSCEVIVSMEDELAQLYLHKRFRKIGPLSVSRGLTAMFGSLVVRLAQRSAERLHFHIRHELLDMDEQLDSTLAFSGRPE